VASWLRFNRRYGLPQRQIGWVGNTPLIPRSAPEIADARGRPGDSMSVQVNEAPSRVWFALVRITPSPLAWCVLATVLLTASAVLTAGEHDLSHWLGDTDDGVRLVSVRELLAGASWFDTTLPRIGVPEPLASHWSRLIDLPIASLILFLTPLVGAEQAETATRIVWPALLFFSLLLIVSREASRQTGPFGGTLAILLAATSLMAFVQFRPGRIDHHNAQVLCAVAGLLLLLRAWQEPRVGWPAGFLLGLGLSIGYEALALVGLAFGITAATALWLPRHGAGVVRAAIALTLTMVAALFVTIPPWRWLSIHCDALALNLPVLAAGGAIGLWAGVFFGRSRFERFLIAGMGVVAGAGGFAALEPACLAGPYGQVSPALRAVFLDHVRETTSILRLASDQPSLYLGTLVFLAAGTAVEVCRWHRRRDASRGLAMAFVVLAVVLGCWQMRLVPYASWLCVLPIARWASGLPAMATIFAPTVRIAAACLLSQGILDSVLGALISPFEGSHPAVTVPACELSANVRRLDTLPTGLVVADLDLSAFIAALTRHRVVAAPYHRLEKSILANHAIMDGSPDKSVKEARVLGIDYFALCNQPSQGDLPTGLRARLLAGEPIPSLQELTLDSEHAIRVWRLAR
jgi:hypothetical protein